ncbi:MAG: glycine--tRNA ligase subunit beta [Acidobacteria bacterium]|nr:MAG: glycine--tRNA ligase subunit beta [Acidobacteriota bacterium]
MKAAAATKEKPIELLFEIGCEEIPAGMLPKAEEELRVNLEKLLAAESLSQGTTVETFSAPRRLTAWVRGLPVKQADVELEITGPPKSVAYDAVGAPTRAALSFAEKQGVHVNSVYLVQTAKGEYLAAKQVKAGRATEQILTGALPRAVHDLSWRKSMTWTGLNGPRFIRPIRWVVAVLDGKPLHVAVAGIAADNSTRGHRFLGAAAIRVRNFPDYEKKLHANGVIIRPSRRQEKISRELEAFAKKGNCRVHEDADLRRLVTYLNEYPTVIQGNFDPAFLNLPDEILVTVMRDHQKYFAIEKRNGELASQFLAVINSDKDPQGIIRAGHERVLRARFADARFFWESDQKCRLADYLPKLERVTYESRLGSYGHKVERVRDLARWLTEQWFNLGIQQAHVSEADRAAELAKCDLATEMVREFPELQGIVGGLYARAQGEPHEIADAVYDHYRPVGLDDSIPRNLTGCAVALADKLDSVVGCLAVGIVPTGSSDPYALRRAALGMVKIILERKLPLSLSLAIGAAGKALVSFKPKRSVTPDQEKKILDFILDRARFVFREKEQFAYDEVSAVFRSGADDLVDAQKRLSALRAIRKSRNFEPLAVSFKRIRKILEKAGVGLGVDGRANPELFESAAERELHSASQAAASKVQSLKRGGKYQEALEVIASLRPVVDKFFDGVMVMAEKDEVRKNRLALLAELLGEFTTIADFSEIGGEERLD